MTPIESLILLTIGYFIIGTAWAAWMHTRMTEFKRAKWIIFVFNINMWPECMVIWLVAQGYMLIKENYMSHQHSDETYMTVDELVANQRALNKENRGKL